MRNDEAEYYRQRALQEELAMKNAASAAARQRHDELASMYRIRAGFLTSGREPRLEEYRKMTMADAE